QAEDGIRNGHVTGVQTCALPISSPREGAGLQRIDLPKSADRKVQHFVKVLACEGTMLASALHLDEPPFAAHDHVHVDGSNDVLRSEERRVGYECRSGL